jgi:peroxiredoxin Q/BCP
MPPLQPGDKAPDFTLNSHAGQSVSLSSYLGRRVVVSFHPATFTGG